MKKILLVLLGVFLILFSGCSNYNLNPNYEDKALINIDFLSSIDFKNVEGAYTIHKFGSNAAVGTTLEPITSTGVYQTPTTAQSLEILSSSSSDSSAGSGARKIFIIGLDANGDEINETVTMNGLTPVTLANQYLRIYRFYVLESGTYATQSAGSHVGTITIRGAGGGSNWAQLSISSGFPVGQSQIGVYTVPRGYNCYLLNKIMSVNSARTANLYFFQRQNITDVTVPYSAMRLVENHIGVTGVEVITSRTPIQRFPELTDIGFMGSATTNAEVEVEFELACLNNTIYP